MLLYLPGWATGGQAEAAAQGGTARLNSLILGASAAGGGQAWMLTLSFFKEHNHLALQGEMGARGRTRTHRWDHPAQPSSFMPVDF